MARKGAPNVPKVRSSTGSQEREILRNAQHLADDPDRVVPKLEGGGFLFNILSPVKRVERHLRKVHDARGDEDKLKKLSKKGPKYARAYAVILRIADKGEVPYLATAQLPSGTVPYANWGEVPGNYHVGLQHWDDRRLRLLAAKDWAQDKGYWFYATDDRLVCTGKDPNPPEGFVDDTLANLDVRGTGSERTCPHGGPGVDDPGLTITWRSADVTLDLCHRCLRPDGNSAHGLLQHVVAPKPWTDLDVEVHLDPLETRGSSPNLPDDPGNPPNAVEAYLRGRLTDTGLLEAAREHRRKALSRTDRRVLVAGETVYGTDDDAFLDALDPNAEERAAIAAALEEHEGPLVLDKPTPGRALQALWPDHGLTALEAVTGDRDLAEELHQEAPEGGDNLPALVRRAARRADRAVLEAELPTYRDLPPSLDLADRVARAYRLDGPEAARQELRNRSVTEGKGKAIAWALTRALGSEEDAWKYGSNAKELGNALEGAAQRLLEVDPDEYHAALSTLSNGAGLGRPPEPETTS